MQYVDDTVFEAVDFEAVGFDLATYDNCTFKNCQFSKVNLERVKFVECLFVQCDLSGVLVSESQWQDVRMEGCKLLGVDFRHVSAFSFQITFKSCTLDHSIFDGRDLRKCSFIESKLIGLSLSEANLSGVTLDNCDLSDATFEYTDLQKADLSTSYGIQLDPAINKVKGAIFSKESLHGLLSKYQIKVLP